MTTNETGNYAQNIINAYRRNDRTDNSEEIINRPTNILFSHNRHSIQNCHYSFNVSVRSCYAVRHDIYYYEALLLTGGNTRVGWTTREAHLFAGINGDIGSDRHGIAFDPADNSVWHSNIPHRNGKSLFKIGDIVGCLVNVQKKQFIFYHNGRKIKMPKNVHFSPQAYFAAVSLSAGQYCYINLGQDPFKFLPNIDKINNFYESTCGIMTKYQLLSPIMTEAGHYWFKDENQNETPLFCDPLQRKVDHLVNKHADDINNPLHNSQTKLTFEQIDCLRLIQSIIESMQIKLIDRSIILDKLCKQLDRTNAGKDNFAAKLFELISSYLRAGVNSDNKPNKSIQCHNICMITIDILSIVDKIPSEIFLPAFQKLSINFINIKTLFNEPQLMLSALECFDNLNFSAQERLELVHESSKLQNESIIATLWWCAEMFGKVIDVSEVSKPKFDYLKLQIGFCSQWLLDNVLNLQEIHGRDQLTDDRLNPTETTTHLKWSKESFCIRSDRNWQSFKQNVLSNAILFYEVVLLTDGPMRIGLTTSEDNLSNNKFGDNSNSVAFDGHNRTVRHNSEDLKIPGLLYKISPWKAGDVVGCSINAKTKQVVFYLNGNPIVCPQIFLDSSVRQYTNLYYAAISLSTHQQCYLNFGQSPFVHPPKELKVIITEQQTELTNQRKSQNFNRAYQKCAQINQLDKIDRIFDDFEQDEYDETMKQFVKDVTCKQIPKIPQPNKPESLLRLVQSAIEVIDPELECEQMDVVSYVLGSLIKSQTKANPQYPNLICKLIYPYLGLRISNRTLPLHRNLCIILSIIASVMKDDLKLSSINLYTQVIAYLTQIVICSNKFKDKCILMFALVALEHLDLDAKSREKLSKNEKFCNILLNFQHLRNVSHTPERVLEQIKFCCSQFYRVVHNTRDVFQPLSDAVLNPQARSYNLKLSDDLLTARSDSATFESVASVCAVREGIYYYEVQLQTSGQAIIGWTTTRLDLNVDHIGSNEYSIGFDGYQKCVWYDDKCFEIKNNSQSNSRCWQAGDVVGCLIDVTAGKFTFYLNKEKLELDSKEDISFSDKTWSEPYYAAVSLFDHQQCRFNFGQEEFKFGQKYVLYNLFYKNVHKSRKSQRKTSSIIANTTTTISKYRNCTIKDTILSQNSKLSANDITISRNKLKKPKRLKSE